MDVPNQEEVEKKIGREVVIWQCNIKEGDVLSKVSDGHSLMGRGYFVLEGESEEVLKQEAEAVKNLFQLK